MTSQPKPTATQHADGDGADWTDAPPDGDLMRFWTLPWVLMGIGDYDGNYRHVSSGYRDVLGWSLDELKSVAWWEFLHPDERDRLADTAQQLMDHAQPGFETIRMLCRDGHYKWIRWYNAVDADRQLFYSVGIDLSDTRPCHDRTAVGTWQWHLPAQTLTLSPELHELLALPTSPTITSEDFLHQIHPDDRARVELRARNSQLTGEPFTEDLRIIGAAGTITWLHVAGRAAHDPAGAVKHLHGIAIDITDQKIRHDI
jgi:PAS domain S-box-containing protein